MTEVDEAVARYIKQTDYDRSVGFDEALAIVRGMLRAKKYAAENASYPEEMRQNGAVGAEVLAELYEYLQQHREKYYGGRHEDHPDEQEES